MVFYISIYIFLYFYIRIKEGRRISINIFLYKYIRI